MTQLLPMMMYCFVMSITPGPNNLMLTASGANFGYRLTLAQVLGCVMGNVVLTLVACNGLGQLFVAFPVAQIVLRSGGTRAAAFGIHGATAVVMLASGATLLLA